MSTNHHQLMLVSYIMSSVRL